MRWRGAPIQRWRIRVGMGGLYRQWVEHDPDFPGLRDHPRFQALLDRMSSPRTTED